MLTIEAAITKPEVLPYLEARAAEYQRLLRRLHVAVIQAGAFVTLDRRQCALAKAAGLAAKSPA